MKRILFFILLSFVTSLQAAALQWVRVSPQDRETAANTLSGDNISSPKLIPGIYYNDLITKVAKQYALDPLLVHAVVAAESAYNSQAVSNKGAVGLMQVMPDTAARFGKYTLQQPLDNLEAGSAYLSYLLQEFNGQTDLALAGYNAGEGAVKHYNYQIPPFSETQQYVKRVNAYYALLRQKMPDSTEPELSTASTVVKPPATEETAIGDVSQLIDVFTTGKENKPLSVRPEF